MTWEELKEKAQEMGACVGNQYVYFNHLEFVKDGCIFLDRVYFDLDEHELTPFISSNRTYEQMYAIMEALKND